ncbi:hypothetical protein CK203_019123 [Vitis vinifera]|uniref:Endonuclease/exonuclease/phosphatase domain-containing protein n=1 Tax=Vitis vinifera TaxID=29760 RepID=A0A438J7E9_VITVI|nr:hypothetical protein CK203_019123 [Vitis vinifera]
MPVEGNEVEILAMLMKLKLRTGSNSLCKRRKKKKSCTTRFERELKRLECSVRLNDCEKRKLIKGMVRNQKPDLVCLFEIKVKEISMQMVKSVGVGRFLNWASVDARGVAGGLLLFWDNRVLENLEVESGGYSISVRFRNCTDGFSWIFFGVYGPVMGSEKEDFWEELGAIRGLWEDPWCIGGDFNAIRFPEERRNASRLTAEMRRFSEVIGELGLRDFPLAEGPFTWIGGLNSQAASRLDRFLISDQWEDHFLVITQSALPRLVSDHSPIVLEAGGFSSSKSPFRFENMWLKIDGFKDLVRSWWNGYSVEGLAENEPLWKQIISSKYDVQEGGWCSKGVRDRYGVGVWKAIRNGWKNFRSHSCFIIGDDTRVKFWKDLWCENQSLEEAFPFLFNLSVNKEGWVAEAWEENEVGGSWGLRFNRHLNDWEVGEVESLLSKLHPLTIRRGVNDSLRWKENKNGTFSVKSFYTHSQGASSPPSG